MGLGSDGCGKIRERREARLPAGGLCLFLRSLTPLGSAKLARTAFLKHKVEHDSAFNVHGLYLEKVLKALWTGWFCTGGDLTLGF